MTGGIDLLQTFRDNLSSVSMAINKESASRKKKDLVDGMLVSSAKDDEERASKESLLFNLFNC